MSHELSHEWFGDSVSVRTWRDIWLNKGFATFASWLWIEHNGGPNTYRFARFVMHDHGRKDRFWKQSIADPSATPCSRTRCTSGVGPRWGRCVTSSATATFFFHVWLWAKKKPASLRAH